MEDNLKNESRLLNELVSKFNVEEKTRGNRRIWMKVSEENLIQLCEFARERGFEHLSTISVTDWINEGEYEITYHLWSYERKIPLTIKTRISRENPVAPSVSPIWDKNAQIHERELHELFGVKFEGNEDLSPLFLEDWQGPPPFRKDFNWREYVRKEHYNRGTEREAVYYE
jgi:NADH-quinone oxidoreductase subunit C